MSKKLIKSKSISLLSKLLFFNFVGAILLFFIRKMLPQGILFDQIIQTALLTVSITALSYWKKQSWREELSRNFHFLLTASLLFIFASTSTLVNIDRSRSFYVISWVGQDLVKIKNGNFTYDKVRSEEKILSAQINLRLNEQVQRGLMKIESNQVKLTRQGKLYLNIAEILSHVYELRGWQENKF